jgi:ribosomal-protein-alanine N-acetyltransferase
MISHLKAEASKNNIQMILLELRQTNKAALKLYSGLGFKQQGIRKKYYSDTGEDALLMTLSTKAD